MTRLIDADAFMEHVKQTVKAGLISEKDERKLLFQINVEAEIHAVDAVPVIRCRECKWETTMPLTKDGKTEWTYCKRTDSFININDYCSRAERKEE